MDGDPGGPWEGPARWGGRETGEELVTAQAGVPLAAIGIEDPERGSPPRRADPAATHHDLGHLAHHVPAEPDPRATGEFEADPGSLPDRGSHVPHEPRRLEDEEADPGPTRQRREPAEPLAEPRRPLRAWRQVQDEQIHRPAREERAGNRQTLVGGCRGEDHQPFRLDAAGDRLDRIERTGEIQPGDDRPSRLRLSRKAQGNRGSPARQVPPEGEAHPAREAARPEDPIELREAGREEPGRIHCGGCHGAGDDHGAGGAARKSVCRGFHHGRGGHRERTHHVPSGTRRGRSPARSKGRQGRRDIRGEDRHQASIIEHLF